MSDSQAELIREISDLSAQIRELVTELRHTQKNHEKLEDRTKKCEDDVRALQLESALNKPILDIARDINRKMWFTILGSAAAVGSLGIDWTKVFGG